MPALKIELSPEIVTALASAGLTQVEVAAACKCSQDTIQRHYLEAYNIGKANLCAGLRKKQTELALKGNITMLIWLGKNLLGQSDKLEATGRDGAPLLVPIDREELIGKLLGPRATPPRPDVVQ